MNKPLLFFSFILLCLSSGPAAYAQKQSGKKAQAKKSIAKISVLTEDDKTDLQEGIQQTAVYDDISTFFNGFAKVTSSGKCGAINTKGREVIPCLYDDDKRIIYHFCEGLALVVHNGNKGYAGIDGKIKINTEFEDAEDFHGGYARVKFKGKWGIIEKSGNLKIPAEYDAMAETKTWDLIPVCKGDKWSYINIHGETVIPFKYAGACGFQHGLAVVYLGENRTSPQVIDCKGKVIIPSGKYAEIGGFYDGYSYVRNPAKEGESRGKCGIIDSTGSIMVPCEYNSTGAYGQWPVPVNNIWKWAYADKSGKVLTEFKYDQATLFQNGYAVVKRKGFWTILNSRLKEVMSGYDAAYTFSEGMAIVADGKKFGYVDTSGTAVIRPVYDMAEQFSSGVARVKLGNEYFFINKDGSRNSNFIIGKKDVVAEAVKKTEEPDLSVDNGAYRLRGRYYMSYLKIGNTVTPPAAMKNDYIKIQPLNGSQIKLINSATNAVMGTMYVKKISNDEYKLWNDTDQGSVKNVLVQTSQYQSVLQKQLEVTAPSSDGSIVIFRALSDEQF